MKILGKEFQKKLKISSPNCWLLILRKEWAIHRFYNIRGSLRRSVIEFHFKYAKKNFNFSFFKKKLRKQQSSLVKFSGIIIYNKELLI